MEILTVLDELYHVNPEDEEKVLQQINKNYRFILFREREKTIILNTDSIVSIEHYKELK